MEEILQIDFFFKYSFLWKKIFYTNFLFERFSVIRLKAFFLKLETIFIFFSKLKSFLKPWKPFQSLLKTILEWKKHFIKNNQQKNLILFFENLVTKNFGNKFFHFNVRFLFYYCKRKLNFFWEENNVLHLDENLDFLILWANKIFLYFPLYFILTDIPLLAVKNTTNSISFDSKRKVLSPWPEN